MTAEWQCSGALIPEKEIGRLWQEMTDVADDADVSLFQVASAMTLTTLDRMDTVRRGALSSIRVVNNLFDEHIVDHYESSIKQIQERGLYFASEWDDRYVPLLELNDAGEPPRQGSLLVTSVGDGVFAYAALSFFRQWAGQVPGAYRLFANLISLDAAEWRTFEQSR